MLNFTIDQIKSISKSVLELPRMIDNPDEGTGLIQQKDNISVQKDEVLKSDLSNKVLSDNMIAVITQYHEELALLSGNMRTTYSESSIQLAGQAKEPHYTANYFGLVPKVIPENNGFPIALDHNETELSILGKLSSTINNFKNGVGGSIVTDTIVSNFAEQTPLQLSTGEAFNVGSTVFVSNGSNIVTCLVIANYQICVGGVGADETTCITNGGTWESMVELEVVSGDGSSIGSGAEISSGTPAFSNSVRGYQATSPSTSIQNFYQNSINDLVTQIKNMYQATKSGLESITDTDATRKQNNLNELGILSDVLTDIDQWENTPVTQANGKYTDSAIVIIETIVTERSARVPNRITELTNMLGNTVDADNGSGAYHSLFNLVVLRTSKSGGTLYTWYNFDLAVSHFDQKIKNANNQLSEYLNIMNVAKLTQDVSVGENIITVDNNNFLSENDSIIICDDENFVQTSVLEINANQVTVTDAIQSTISLEKIGRVIKYV